MESPKSKKEQKGRHVSICHQLWYQCCRTSVWFVLKLLFFTRYRGRKNIPWSGPVLVVANHQSFLDPPAIGAGIIRRMNYLARKTLFRFKPFGWLIDSVDAIPLDQEGIGFAGIKETLRRLKNKEMVLIFPEGARCLDGEMDTFKEGFITLALRSQATIVPTAITGSYESWPRSRKLPCIFFHPLKIQYGEPLRYEDYKDMDPHELHVLVENRVRELYDGIRKTPKKIEK